MKLLLFSDIHGNNYSFDSFISNVSKNKNDYQRIFLGDFVGYYYGANEIINYCRKNNILCILGNHDKYFLDVIDGKIDINYYIKKYGNSYQIALDTISQDNIDFLRQLDKNTTVSFDNKKVYICHGSPLDNLEGRIYPDTDLTIFKELVKNYNYVINGHTHHKMARKMEETTFLNPGSLGQQRDAKGCSYMTLDLKKDIYEFYTVDYPIDKLEEEIDLYDSGRAGLKEVLRR